MDENMLEKLAAAYTKGCDKAAEVLRRETAGLLERSGKERAELEARVEQLERIGERLLHEYKGEEEEHGFPFNFALRDAHRELHKALFGERREEDVGNSAEELHARSYHTADDVEIVWRDDGAWAIADDYGYVLNRSGVWEWEWNPGSRDAAFIERTRYETPREALKHWKACSEIQKEEGDD